MPNFVTRIFAYPILERELNNRIADRDNTIEEQRLRIEELENRLYIRFGLPPKGIDLTASQGTLIPPYRSGRQRVRDMLTPSTTVLSEEDEKTIKESLTQ